MTYRFEPSEEQVPAKAWHTHFIDEATPTPEGHLNASADSLNRFLKACLDDRLERTAARTPWREYSKFLAWAMWGYLSPDSKYKGDERLLRMSREWMDHLFTKLQTKPEDPEKAENWRPDRLGTWSFADYSTPMLEIQARPELAEKLGRERVAHYRAILLKNIDRYTSAQSWNSLLERAQPYVNIATHPMAIYIHGWLLTGEEKHWCMAASLVAILARDQLPNGMFPYRYRIYGDDHSEFEGMYYHAINIRALYMYWWATGSKLAKRVLDKSVPYYPLNMEPPYHFNDGPAIWWKNIWRTFWPQHIAMVAAVTGDGENARIALDMARDGVSRDRIDLFLGAHAYQLLALKGIEPTPVRDRYIVRDPDIRGVRLRFSPWSTTFSTGSFTYTRAGAILIREGKGLNALHMARPYLRVKPLEKKPKYELDYGTLSRHGAPFSAALTKTAAAVATQYRLASTAQTWRKQQALAPLDMIELWIMTPTGMIGIIDSRAVEAFDAYEFNHQFRFIVGRKGSGEKTGKLRWTCGGLKFRIWATNFPHAIEERTRRYAMAQGQRIDWQVSLADMDRLPEHIAQDDPPPPQKPGARPMTTAAPKAQDALDELEAMKTKDKLPVRHTIAVGYSRFSVVEVSPTDAGFADVSRLPHDALVVLHGTTTGQTWIAVYNPSEEPHEWKHKNQLSIAAVSWSDKPAAAAQASIVVPPSGVVLLKPDAR